MMPSPPLLLQEKLRKTEREKKRISFHFLLPKRERERETGRSDVDARRGEIRISSHLIIFCFDVVVVDDNDHDAHDTCKANGQKDTERKKVQLYVLQEKCEGDSASLKSAVA